MRVIKPGKRPEDEEIELTCGHCGAVIAVVISEMECVPDQRDGDYYSIRCPMCQRRINRDARALR
jgi:hypothetical protein